MENDIVFFDDVENEVGKIVEQNKNVLHKSFVFYATSYEIYGNGQCLKSGICQITIKACASKNDISFSIQNNNEINIDNHFSMEFRSDDLLMDRIVYGRLSDNTYVGSNSFPVVCEIFIQKNLLRFALLSPLRLIEFSGCIEI